MRAVCAVIQKAFFLCQMQELEETHRLQEIQAKMDCRCETRVRDGRLFKSGELLRRRLVHEGTLVWKTSGTRLKGRQHHGKHTSYDNLCLNPESKL